MSNKCDTCGRENLPDSAFCGGCGASITAATELVCKRCGTTLPPSAVFCGICGSTLNGGQPEGRAASPGSSAAELANEPTLSDPSASESPAGQPETSQPAASELAGIFDSAEDRTPVHEPTRPVPANTAQPFRMGPSLREMVTVSAARFMMGSLSGYGNQDECPRHEVQLSRFQVDRFAVSNIEFECFRPEHFRKRTSTSSGDLDPVVFVTWDDCLEYCRWRSEAEGLPPETYRLPTEAQWECAARGGEDSLYPWGNEIAAGSCNTREAGLGKAAPVDEGLPNSFNILHMGSNVREWCQDWYNHAYYAMEDSTGVDPQGPPAMDIVNMKVVRGASFQDVASELSRCAARNYAHPRTESDDIGFRCVRDA